MRLEQTLRMYMHPSPFRHFFREVEDTLQDVVSAVDALESVDGPDELEYALRYFRHATEGFMEACEQELGLSRMKEGK